MSMSMSPGYRVKSYRYECRGALYTAEEIDLLVKFLHCATLVYNMIDCFEVKYNHIQCSYNISPGCGNYKLLKTGMCHLVNLWVGKCNISK